MTLQIADIKITKYLVNGQWNYFNYLWIKFHSNGTISYCESWSNLVPANYWTTTSLKRLLSYLTLISRFKFEIIYDSTNH